MTWATDSRGRVEKRAPGRHKVAMAIAVAELLIFKGVSCLRESIKLVDVSSSFFLPLPTEQHNARPRPHPLSLPSLPLDSPPLFFASCGN